MENKPSNAEQALPPEQAAAKAAILAECERLAEAEITFVVVQFDGSGDPGVNEDIKYYATEDYGYEDGWGGFGDVLLNVQTRKITVERNDRFEDCTTSSHEGLHGPPNEAR